MELRRAAELFDSVPPRLRLDAQAAFTFRSVDTELAELTFDSLGQEALLVRGAGGRPRVLTFTATALTIEVEVIGHQIVGRLIPARQVEIDVRGRDHTITVTADQLGRFTAGPLSAGPFSLRCRVDPDVVTEWVSAR